MVLWIFRRLSRMAEAENDVIKNDNDPLTKFACIQDKLRAAVTPTPSLDFPHSLTRPKDHTEDRGVVSELGVLNTDVEEGFS